MRVHSTFFSFLGSKMKFLQKKWNLWLAVSIINRIESAKEHISKSGFPEVFYKILESWKVYRADQVLGGGFSCCCRSNHWRIVGSSLEPMLSLLRLLFFLSIWFLGSFFAFCEVFLSLLSLWRHLSFTREILSVAFFKKQLKYEHNERNAEFKVLERHARSGEH